MKEHTHGMRTKGTYTQKGHKGGRTECCGTELCVYVRNWFIIMEWELTSYISGLHTLHDQMANLKLAISKKKESSSSQTQRQQTQLLFTPLKRLNRPTPSRVILIGPRQQRYGFVVTCARRLPNLHLDRSVWLAHLACTGLLLYEEYEIQQKHNPRRDIHAKQHLDIHKATDKWSNTHMEDIHMDYCEGVKGTYLGAGRW